MSPHAKEEGRPYVGFSFYRIDPAYRRLQSNEKVVLKQEFLSAVEPFQKKLHYASYSLVGLKADCDLLLWRTASDLERLQEMTSRLQCVGIGRWLVGVRSYLGVGSAPASGEKPAHEAARGRYLLVRPVTKTRAWHALSADEQKRLSEEPQGLLAKRPSVKIHAVSSLGLDDPDAVLAVETDDPQDLAALQRELGASKSALYIQSDTPAFLCAHQDLGAILDSLG